MFAEIRKDAQRLVHSELSVLTHMYNSKFMCFVVQNNYSIKGCLLNIVFYPKILKYSGLWPFSVFPRCQCLYTHQAGRKPALQQNWQSSEKSQIFKEKNTIFNEHPNMDRAIILEACKVCLAREAGISYTSLALATDYDCWKEDNQVIEN